MPPPLRIIILDDEGETVYTEKASHISVDNLMLRLEKGNYKVYLSDFEGGGFNINYRLD